MNKYKITQKIENFAPLELAENWDCSGWGVETSRQEVKKIMLALTVTQDVVNQARQQNCDMIISHHPLFIVPCEWSDIDIYSAHTNMDKTDGGTTDTLIKNLGLEICEKSEFLRYTNTDITVEDFGKKIHKISPNLRYTNNNNTTHLSKIAFCAGSGSDFIEEATKNGADAIVTGDLKFHTALDSQIVVFDIGHFESEILILQVFKDLLCDNAEIVLAKEISPFIY